MIVGYSRPLAAAARVNLTNHTVSDTSTTPGAEASFILNLDGRAQHGELVLGTSGDYSGEWRVSGASADYESRVTKNSGTTPTTGTLNTWQALSSTRTWALATDADPQTRTCNLTVEIRDAVTLVVLDSCTVVLNAETTT